MKERNSVRRAARRSSSAADSRPGGAHSSDMSVHAHLGEWRDPSPVRERTGRACDRCRRRKSRCDGQMKCSACNVVGLQCSYDYTVKQVRGPLYVAHLEKKVQDLENRIRRTSIAPEASDGEAALSTLQLPKLRSDIVDSLTSTSVVLRPFSFQKPSPRKEESLSYSSTGSSPSLSRLSTTRDPDTIYINTIASEARGKAFGIDILRQLWNLCNRITSSSAASRPDSSIKLVQALNTPFPLDLMSFNGGNTLLPAKLQVINWICIAFSESFHLWPFVDREYVDQIISRIYNTSTFGQEPNDRDDLALLYAVLALGQRFDVSIGVNAQERRMQGFPYFAAARDIVPLVNCDRSLTAVQTVLCMVLYLKAGSAQMRVHAYVSAAASAAIRMGLYEHVPCFPEHELALRMRLWSTICVLDTYVSSSLGIPRTVSIRECDSECKPAFASNVPSEEVVTATSHVRLMSILGRAIDKMYLHPGGRTSIGVGMFGIPQLAVQEVCDEIDSWAVGCLALSTPVENMHTSQLLLSYAYAHVQLLLLTPFVHHLAQASVEPTLNEYRYGIRAVKAAFHAVKVAGILLKRLNLNEAYFTTVDVLAFASMTLLVVELGCSNDTLLLAEAIRSSKLAKELLLVLSFQSQTAFECWEAISVCW